jgi:hypothetical protein
MLNCVFNIRVASLHIITCPESNIHKGTGINKGTEHEREFTQLFGCNATIEASIAVVFHSI